MMEESKKKVAQSMKMNLDGRTDNLISSVHAVNLILPDKSVAQWCCEDFFGKAHTAENIVSRSTSCRC